MLSPFTIHRPDTVAQASAMLAQYGPDAAIYAGGTELLVLMKERLAHFSHLIDIKPVPGLAGITIDDAGGSISIGPLASHRSIETSPLLMKRRLPPVSKMAWTRIFVMPFVTCRYSALVTHGRVSPSAACAGETAAPRVVADTIPTRVRARNLFTSVFVLFGRRAALSFAGDAVAVAVCVLVVFGVLPLVVGAIARGLGLVAVVISRVQAA